MKAFKKFLGGLLFIFCMVSVEVCTKGIFKAQMNKNVVTKSNVNEKLRQLERKLNKDLPKQLDEITILKKVEALSGKEIRYHYTILLDELEITELEIMQQKQSMIKSLKQENNMELFKKHGVTMSYTYETQQGKHLFDITITPEDYR